jgi:ABC-type polar amino acid transport system ATPase subunit
MASNSASIPLIAIRGVNKYFGHHHVLKDIDLEVAKGEVVVVIGPSGSGKSTLCRAINRLETIDSGEIRIDGVLLPQEGKDLAKLRSDVGMVFQAFNLFAHKTALENVTLAPIKVRKTPKAEAERRAMELLTRVGVADHATKLPAQLSGGQQQRVALARALARRPRIVLLDEPFSSLDAGLRTSTRRAVADALAAEGVTVLLVTHDQDEALSFADQIVVMEAGHVRQVGTPQQVYAAPSDRATAAFLGDLVTLVGTCSDGVVECALGRLPTLCAAGGQVEVALRPEQVILGPAIDGRAVGTVLRSDYFGHDVLVHTQLEDGSTVLARVTGSVDLPEPGQRVGVHVTGPVLAYPLV